MEIKLLDHGYLKLIETWGSDERIIESARMSTAKGFLGWGRDAGYVVRIDTAGSTSWLHGAWMTSSVETEAEFFATSLEADVARMAYQEKYGYAQQTSVEPRPAIIGDEKLLRFLWENEHATPFEMAGITVEVKAPIMVFREWHRHRVPFGYNEMSARYVPLPNENYVPGVPDLLERSLAAATTKNKQAAGTGVVLVEPDALEWLAELADVYEHAERVYQKGLKIGVPKELARLPVPVARYSCMRATANLRGWLGFLRLRAAPSAQKEIRVYAEALGSQIIATAFPRTWQLFSEGRK